MHAGPASTRPAGYAALRTLRARGGLALSSARGPRGACVLITPAAGFDPAVATAALTEVRRVHGLLDHPLIPRVAAHDDGSSAPFVELACDAVVDGVELLGALGADGLRVPYGQADALVSSLREALETAHATLDPTTGAPICIGRLSHANVLFSRSGRWSLIGFGSNFPCAAPAPGDGGVVVFQAPEVAIGAPATPGGDYVALLSMTRSLLAYIEVNEAIARLVRGEPTPDDLEVGELIRWFDRSFTSVAPKDRPSVAEAVEVSRRIRERLGVVLDADGFARTVATLLDAGVQAAGAGEDAGLALRIAADASWIEIGDATRQRLSGPVRRLLVALLERQRHGDVRGAGLAELLAAGWPDERPTFESGANRVYVTLARLRRLGLRDAIERFEGGYRLAPSTVVDVVER